MKLLTKVLMTVALIGTCNVWGDSYSTYEYGDGRYQRVSLSSRSSPAYATNRYLDPNHEAMIASKLYTKDDAECMTKEALKRFLDDFGIDFSTVTPDEFGQRLIPGVALFATFVYGLTIADKANVLISDTAYPDRSYTSEWFWVEYGQIVIFLKDGEVPACRR